VVSFRDLRVSPERRTVGDSEGGGAALTVLPRGRLALECLLGWAGSAPSGSIPPDLFYAAHPAWARHRRTHVGPKSKHAPSARGFSNQSRAAKSEG
jgi:hypothetical protein